MKKLRKDIYTKIIRDYNLEEKYLAMEIYLKNQMFKNISKIINLFQKYIWYRMQKC